MMMLSFMSNLANHVGPFLSFLVLSLPAATSPYGVPEPLVAFDDSSAISCFRPFSRRSERVPTYKRNGAAPPATTSIFGKTAEQWRRSSAEHRKYLSRLPGLLPRQSPPAHNQT